MIKPRSNYVLISPDTPEEKTKGGILVAKKEDKQDTGVVVAIGSSIADLVTGDKVIFQKYGPAEVTYEKEKYVLAHDDEILGRVE